MRNVVDLFVHPDNQTLLWETISRSPSFMIWNVSPQEKERLFQDTVKHFYLQYVSDPFPKMSLQDMNRETIMYMVNWLHRQPSILPSTSPSPPPRRYPENIQQSFETLQKEYEKMSTKPTPTAIDFKEKIEDTPLPNIQELLEKQQRDRENIFVAPAPAPPVPAAVPAPTPSAEINDLLHLCVKELRELKEWVKSLVQQRDVSSPSPSTEIPSSPESAESKSSLQLDVECLPSDSHHLFFA